MERTEFSDFWAACQKDDVSTRTAEALSGPAIEAAVFALRALILESDAEGDFLVRREAGVFSTSPGLIFNGVRTAILGLIDDSADSQAAFRQTLQNRTREALCLCILPRSDFNIWPLDDAEMHVSAGSAIPVYRSDLEALGRSKTSLSTLLEYKLFRRLVLDKPDAATRYHEYQFDEFIHALRSPTRARFAPLADIISELAENPDDWVAHPLAPRVSRILEERRGCLLVGPSSSGKSVLCFQIGRHRLLAGANVLYLNLGTVSTEPLDVLTTFLGKSQFGIPDLIVVDDLQSNPATTRYILAVSNLVRRAAVRLPIPVLASSWTDFALEASTWHEQCFPFAIQSTQVRDAILRQYGGGISDEIIRMLVARFGDDLLLLRLALQQAKRVGTQPLLKNVAEQLWKQRTEDSIATEAVAVKATLIAGSLGRYDISAPIRFLEHEAKVEDHDIELLTRTRLLRRHGDYVSMGHRSLCALLSDWLGAKGGWKLLGQEGGPRDTAGVVLDYLRSLGSRLTVDSLRALHARAGLKDRPLLNRRAIALIEIWRAFDAIVERIERQQEKDPTWNAVPSSAMFAIQALAEVGKPELALNSLRFLREHWIIENGKLKVLLQGLNTHLDFQGIKMAMLEEDERTSPQEARWASAGEVDFDRFHQTWLSGVILSAEAAGQQPTSELTKLAESVEALQLPSGSFYPERVPWSTARVLLGLGACGRNIHTSRAVARSVSWLLRLHTEGGALRDGLWLSGTGSWNNTLETTGMVLLALAAVGFDVSDRRLFTARSYLVSERPRWTAAGGELAGAQAMQAYLDTGGSWGDVAQEAQRLSQWARGTALWEGATATEKGQLEQTCLVAQIASHLIGIGWTAIRSDLPAFLDSLATPYQYEEELVAVQADVESPLQETPAAVAEKTISESASSSTRPNAILQMLRLLSSISITRSVVVGQYVRYDERVRNQLKDWCARISRPLITPTDVHENFLIWAAPGSGKSFLVQQLALSLGPAVRYLELNLAALPQAEFIEGLRSIGGHPTLCLLDEIDARADELWPYEEMLSTLDINRTSPQGIVIVLVGSHAEGLESMAAGIHERWKGKDLLDRIPADRRFEIPPPMLEDKVMVIASQVREAARLRGTHVVEIEKMLLYYALANQDLHSPRQLSDLARDAVKRLSASDDRLRYDNLFEAGNIRNQRFFAEHLAAANELSGVFVRIDD